MAEAGAPVEGGAASRRRQPGERSGVCYRIPAAERVRRDVSPHVRQYAQGLDRRDAREAQAIAREYPRGMKHSGAAQAPVMKLDLYETNRADYATPRQPVILRIAKAQYLGIAGHGA